MINKKELDHPEWVNESLYEKQPLRDRAYPVVVGASLVVTVVLLIVSNMIKEVR